jgi:hypothetical protein
MSYRTKALKEVIVPQPLLSLLAAAAFVQVIQGLLHKRLVLVQLLLGSFLLRDT